MIQDTINSIKVTLNERMGNPFVSAYVISSFFSNWKFFLLVLSDLSYDEKLTRVSFLYADKNEAICGFIIIPIGFSAFWTFCWPLVNWGINWYWYSIRSRMANTKNRVERNRTLSEKDAAEIYVRMDSQETKYFEMLKDKQKENSSLLEEIEKLNEELGDLHRKIIERDSSIRELNDKVRTMSSDSISEKERSKRFESERNISQQSLKHVLDNALRASELLPGLKSFSIAINDSANFRADEQWVKERFRKLEPSFSDEEMMIMLELFLSIGLLEREVGGYLKFGERFKYMKEKIIGMYDNSSGPPKPNACEN